MLERNDRKRIREICVKCEDYELFIVKSIIKEEIRKREFQGGINDKFREKTNKFFV